MNQKIKSILLLLCLLNSPIFAQHFNQKIVTQDIDNFWVAYDSIHTTTDSVKQLRFINDLYIKKRTPGLDGFMQVRRYKDAEFVKAINMYPQYFNSIRARTINSNVYKDTIIDYINRLYAIYPKLKPSTVYFAFGVFRSGGTYYKNSVLLGAEFLFATQNSPISELPARNQRGIKENAPVDIPLTALHEYIHTQQKQNWVEGDIIIRCVAEGVAEFISTLLTNKPLSPSVAFGKKNKDIVVKKYMEEIFQNNKVGNWLWNKNENELIVNDLGYYIGYEICESYYNKSKDKQKAIKELIELDYFDEKAFAKIVDGSGFLPMTYAQMDAKYKASLPQISKIMPFNKGDKNVSPALDEITIEFNAPMDTCCRSFDYGKLGKNHSIQIDKVIGWSEDKKRFTFKIKPLKPNKEYQFVLSNFAKQSDNNRLEPYSINFTTATK